MKILETISLFAASLFLAGSLAYAQSFSVTVGNGVSVYSDAYPYVCPDGLYYPDTTYCGPVIVYYDWYGLLWIFHPWYDRNGWEHRNVSRDGRIGHHEGDEGHRWSGSNSHSNHATASHERSHNMAHASGHNSGGHNPGRSSGGHRR